MTPQAVVTAIVTTGALCLAMMLLVVLIKTGRGLRSHRRAGLLAPYRQDLIVVGAGEDHDGECARRLAKAGGAAAAAVTDAVVQMLGKIRGTPAEQLVVVLAARGEVAEALARLSSASPLRRARAAHTLGLCRHVSAVPQLIDALDDTAVEVRASAAHALGLIGAPAAAAPLLRAVGATDAGIPAGIAAEALLGMGVGITDALRTGLAAPHARTRNLAAHVSGAGSFTRSRPQLRTLLANDADLTVREACAAALGAIGGTVDVPVLARHTHPEISLPLRRACTTALGDLGDPGAVPALAALLGDPDPRLAELAAAAMIRLGPMTRLAEAAEAEESDQRRGRPVQSALVVARLQAAAR